MLENQIDEIESAIAAWAENHPNPDESFLAVGSGIYSPRQILEHVKLRTLIGDVVRERIKEIGLERVLGQA